MKNIESLLAGIAQRNEKNIQLNEKIPMLLS